MSLLPGQSQAQISEDGKVTAPRCCYQPMADNGGCAEGCCDDYKCEVCGKSIRVEWPD